MFRYRSIYKTLLLLYPERYRKKYGPQMAQTMEDMLTNESSVMHKASIWLKEIILLPGNVLEQHMIVISRRGGLAPNTLMGFTALAQLLPFLIAMMLDEVSEHLYHQHLYDSWLWSKPVLTIWVILLPLSSLFISLGTYLLPTLRASIRAGTVTFQIKRLWLVIATGVMSMGILFIVAFHGSAHCWLDNSVDKATQLDKVVQCIESDFLSNDNK